eukprot:14696052-Alexandrium_andersonii.AAC.1
MSVCFPGWSQKTIHLPTLAQKRVRDRAKQYSLEPRCNSPRVVLSRTDAQTMDDAVACDCLLRKTRATSCYPRH